eukprot:TRINITY_DN407_c1_g1_i1.p1 TRINITY_DN407_c1_g1~~TRINITY_DN407_c1_g1_i1.p1  ORF type:complete len:655 (+),score=165.45 TRINITY_DN407_c1_g1_i1:367-2331(+)
MKLNVDRNSKSQPTLASILENDKGKFKFDDMDDIQDVESPTIQHSTLTPSMTMPVLHPIQYDDDTAPLTTENQTSLVQPIESLIEVDEDTNYMPQATIEKLLAQKEESYASIANELRGESLKDKSLSTVNNYPSSGRQGVLAPPAGVLRAVSSPLKRRQSDVVKPTEVFDQLSVYLDKTSPRNPIYAVPSLMSSENETISSSNITLQRLPSNKQHSPLQQPLKMAPSPKNSQLTALSSKSSLHSSIIGAEESISVIDDDLIKPQGISVRVQMENANQGRKRKRISKNNGKQGIKPINKTSNGKQHIFGAKTNGLRPKSKSDTLLSTTNQSRTTLATLFAASSPPVSPKNAPLSSSHGSVSAGNNDLNLDSFRSSSVLANTNKTYNNNNMNRNATSINLDNDSNMVRKMSALSQKESFETTSDVTPWRTNSLTSDMITSNIPKDIIRKSRNSSNLKNSATAPSLSLHNSSVSSLISENINSENSRMVSSSSGVRHHSKFQPISETVSMSIHQSKSLISLDGTHTETLPTSRPLSNCVLNSMMDESNVDMRQRGFKATSILRRNSANTKIPKLAPPSTSRSLRKSKSTSRYSTSSSTSSTYHSQQTLEEVDRLRNNAESILSHCKHIKPELLLKRRHLKELADSNRNLKVGFSKHH